MNWVNKILPRYISHIVKMEALMVRQWFSFWMSKKSLVEEYQKTHSFATLTREFCDTPQLVNKNRTHAFSME